MKFLRLDLHFKLPDDFAGTAADAVRLLANQLDSESTPDPVARFSHGIDFSSFMWNVDRGANATGRIAVYQALETPFRWQAIPLGFGKDHICVK